MGGTRVTTEIYMDDVKEIHKDKGYEYKSEWEYTSSKCLIDIKCPTHGWWTTKAYSHRGMKSGCPECAQEYKDSLCSISKGLRLARESIKIAERQQERDDYFTDKVYRLYGNSLEILSECLPMGCYLYLRCVKHDHKYYRSIDALSNRGCKYCAEEAINKRADECRSSLEDVLDKFYELHGNKYDYSEVEYSSKAKKVKIICREHGPFWTTPTNHIVQRSGCASCATTGFDKNKEGTLYYIKIPTDRGDYYKIGITNYNPQKRFSKDSGKYEVIKTWCYESGQDAYDEEQRVLKQYKEYRGCPEDFEWSSSGTTEMFVCDVLGLDNTM